MCGGAHQARCRGMPVDELMPRERGLVLGNKWARLVRQHEVMAYDEDGRERDPVAEAARETPHIADDLRRSLMEEGGLRKRLDASEDPDAESAFWAGFRDGARAYLFYLVELRSGVGSN